jgi:hypothetical protein
MSLSLNLLYAAFKLTAGLYYASFWYGADALYYTVLSMVRALLLRHVRNENSTLEKEYRQYRFCGYLLLALNATLTGVVFQIVNHNMGYEYPGLVIYAVATFTFAYLVTAIVNVVRYAKTPRPLVSAVKMTSFAQALVAVFALQTAMFASFGDSDSETFEGLMKSLTGGGVCFVMFAMAVYMIVRANRKLKNPDNSAGNPPYSGSE